MIGEGGKNIFTKDEYKKIIDKLDAYTSTTGMTYSALDDNVADSGRKRNHIKIMRINRAQVEEDIPMVPRLWLQDC